MRATPHPDNDQKGMPLEDFTVLYEQAYQSLVRIMRHHVGGSEDAEDLAQQALIEAWLSRGAFQPGRPTAKWLGGIAANVRRSWIAKEQGRRVIAPMQSLDALQADPTWRCDVDSGENVEQEVVDADAFEGLLCSLPPRQAEALQLLYGEDLSYAQAAERTGTTSEAIRRRRKLGESALRAHLRQVQQEDRPVDIDATG